MSQTQIYDVFKKPLNWLLVLSDNNDILYLIVYQFINFSFLLISKNKLPIKGQLFAIIPVNNPVFFRVFQKFHQVDIVEQMDFAKTNQIGKCPMPLQPLFDDRQQKIDH